jgi:hypothetical protein
MSLKPGIAKGWFDRFSSDVYPEDVVVLRGGKRSKPPRYYDKLYLLRAVQAGDFSSLYDDVIEARVIKAKSRVDDNTPSRLLVKEQITKSNLSRLIRKIS